MNLTDKVLVFWNSSKSFRVYVWIISILAVLALIAWLILTILANGKIQTAQIILEKDLTPYHQKTDEFRFRAKLRFENAIFRYQRNISHIKITHISCLDSASIISINPSKNAKDSNQVLEFNSSKSLKVSQILGFAEYETSFSPLPKSILFYFVVLILMGLILRLLWRFSPVFVLSLFAFIVFSLVILALNELLILAPFVFIGLGAFLLCVVFAFKSKNTRIKLFLSYFSILPFCFAVAEFYFFTQSKFKAERIQAHEILGFAYTPLYSQNYKLKIDNKLVANLLYSYDEFGNRITPNNNEKSKKCLAVYGGSFAHGDGIDANETIQAFLVKELPEFKVLNFGIGGAGAHTMLARLQFQMDSQILSNCDEFVAIYEAIPHHIYRAYGVFLGPNYKLNKDKKPVYWGTFKPGEYENQRFVQEVPIILPKPTQAAKTQSFYKTLKNKLNLKNNINKSYIKLALSNKSTSLKTEDLLKGCYKGFCANPDIAKLDTNNIGLYFSIVKSIQDELEKQYGVPLYIVLWDYDMHAHFLDKYDETLKSNFKLLQVPFWAVSQIIKDYPQDLERIKNGDFEHFKYRVSRWDTHPNALANEKIAKFLAEKIKNGEIELKKIKRIDDEKTNK